MSDQLVCVVINATTGLYIYIALTTVQYGIYCPGGSFDLRHRWATITSIDIIL